ncbi:MAG: DNA recombination/repair protein RecA, partial [Pseudothermotoga sp.]
IYGKGVVSENELFNIGLVEGFIQRKGSWFFYVAEDGKEYSLGQGKGNVVSYFAENPVIAREIEMKIRQKYNLPTEVSNEKSE